MRLFVNSSTVSGSFFCYIISRNKYREYYAGLKNVNNVLYFVWSVYVRRALFCHFSVLSPGVLSKKYSVINIILYYYRCDSCTSFTLILQE